MIFTLIFLERRKKNLGLPMVLGMQIHKHLPSHLHPKRSCRLMVVTIWTTATFSPIRGDLIL